MFDDDLDGFFSDPDNERFFVEWCADKFSAPTMVSAIVDLSEGALEPFPAPGICPDCGSVGCAACEPTDKYPALDSAPAEPWSDLINSPIVTE